MMFKEIIGITISFLPAWAEYLSDIAIINSGSSSQEEKLILTQAAKQIFVGSKAEVPVFVTRRGELEKKDMCESPAVAYNREYRMQYVLTTYNRERPFLGRMGLKKAVR